MKIAKKYFIEFVIVFMAVFLGTVAENYREQYKEQKQGREYISRFYQDLYSDLSNINQTIELNESKMKRLLKIDSLKFKRPGTPEEFLRVYNTFRSASIWVTPNYMPNYITLDQIKNTGAWEFMTDEHSNIVTRYQISAERIVQINDNLNQDVRETYNLVKKIPNDLSRYDIEDFDNRELQNLHNYIHELYWSHFGYSVILNQHKHFVTEIIQKLASDPEVIKNHEAYDIAANIISIVGLQEENQTFSNNDQILIEENNKPNTWSAYVEVDSGQYLFRKGMSFDKVWGVSSMNIVSIDSGKALNKGGRPLNLIKGKYFVQLNLNDTTYLIQKMD